MSCQNNNSFYFQDQIAAARQLLADQKAELEELERLSSDGNPDSVPAVFVDQHEQVGVCYRFVIT